MILGQPQYSLRRVPLRKTQFSPTTFARFLLYGHAGSACIDTLFPKRSIIYHLGGNPGPSGSLARRLRRSVSENRCRLLSLSRILLIA